MDSVSFEILLRDGFPAVVAEKSLAPIHNKYILSLINDFENGKWRYDKFQNYIWDNIAQSALSAKERESLLSKAHTSLVQSAKNLRLTDKESDTEGSELAEVLLYGIMKDYYGALPVVPKIFYKQNAQDNAKGADSVHIVIENDNDFSLWLGEAKFYNSIEDARLYKIVYSVESSLDPDKLKKENRIVTSISDIDNLSIEDELKQKIKSLLSGDTSIDKLKPKLHIPILLLHECAITKTQENLTDEYKGKILQYHVDRAESYFKKQINRFGSINLYSEIRFHVILFPVPIKSKILESFISNVEHYKKQAENGNI